MKLSIASFENLIPLEKSQVTVIVISDVHFFSKIVRSFYSAYKGDESEIPVLLIDDNEKRLDISSHCEFILSPLSIEFSSRRFSTALINSLKTEFNNDVEGMLEVVHLLKGIQERIISMLDDFDLPLTYEDDWDASRIIKGLSIIIDDDIKGLSQFDMLMRYLQIVSELRIAEYHVFVGLRSILTPEEMDAFFKEALQRQVQIICLEQSESIPSSNKYAFMLHVDEDYEERIILPKQSETLFI